jgi:hypothetical protein
LKNSQNRGNAPDVEPPKRSLKKFDAKPLKKPVFTGRKIRNLL